MIQQEDVPLVSTMAAILVAGRIDGMYDVKVSVTDAVHVAVCILSETQTKVGVNGRRRFIFEARQPEVPHHKYQDANLA
jgi:hypothetical protein